MTDLKKLWSDQLPAQDCELEYWFREAENYAEVQIPADDLRAIIARTYAAVNAVPELLALREEVGRLREALKPFAEARLESWGQRTQGVGDYLTRVWIGTAPNVAFYEARAALNQESGS